MVQVTPPFGDTRYLTNKGVVTPLLRKTFVEVCQTYEEIARFGADRLRMAPLASYALREVHVVGSVLKGVDNSDVDLLAIADKITWEDYRYLKMALNALHFNNRSKYSAVDVYVQPEDDRPGNPRFEITSQLEAEISELNKRLGYTRA